MLTKKEILKLENIKDNVERLMTVSDEAFINYLLEAEIFTSKDAIKLFLLEAVNTMVNEHDYVIPIHYDDFIDDEVEVLIDGKVDTDKEVKIDTDGNIK
jgi:hypothetical protein